MKKRLITALKLVGAVLLAVVILALAALPAVFMNTMYGYLPILFLVIALLVSAGCLLWLRRRIVVVADCEDLQCVRGAAVDVGLKLVNQSRLACPQARASLFISDLFGENDALREIPFTLSGKETIDLGFGMDMRHIGLYAVGLDHVELRDFFGIFKCRVPVTGRFTAFVTPRIRPINEFNVVDEVLAESDVDTRVTVVGGMDYTGVREYIPGDPMKQIHWKLSAHARDYMTRLQESNRQQEYAVILDFAAEQNDNREQLMDLNDCLIETALSLIEDISHHDAGYALLYTDRAGQIARTNPRGREDDMELLRSFSVITPEPPGDYPDACQILSREGQRQNRCTNAVVVTSRITPELIEAMLQVKRQRRSPELYYIVPAVWNSRELEAATASLHQLTDADIPFFLISTESLQAAEVPVEGREPA